MIKFKLNKERMMDRVEKMKRIRLKRVLIGMIIAVGVFSLAVAGITKMVTSAIDSVFAVSHEDRKTSETLDNLEKLYSKDGSEFDVDSQWGDDDVLSTIHKMSHQKVKADHKWGSIQITEERIDTLIQIVQQRRPHLAHYNLYITILGEWEKGDFSNVDFHHNQVWALQDGTVGEAYGIMSEEEEKEYIESVFE